MEGTLILVAESFSGRNDIDYRRRVHLDCWYVKNWSLWYDLVILLKPIPIVVMGRGAY